MGIGCRERQRKEGMALWEDEAVMGCSCQNCQMLLSHIISHSYVKETQVFLAVSLHGTVTQFNSLKQQEKNNPKTNPEKNRFWFGVGSGWGWVSVSCTSQSGHRGGKEALIVHELLIHLNSALPSCETGASQRNRNCGWREAHLDYKSNQQRMR